MLTTLGVLELFVFAFLSLFPSLFFFPTTNAQLQLFVSPPASCQLERLSVDILTQHLLPTGEIGTCQKKLVASHVKSYQRPSAIIITIGVLLLSYDESCSGK